ncbi:bifunctional DNA primase/polymerase [Nocardia terpenica]|uniref:bifunctional DNA primase/polymerase n=1 Tax=Nocardia terpenica TaxID=455432 RepID=UPI0018943C51|nr:bifunctional DNA primase/polymerase [Nocardia terpenica]MBF6062042.1 bifunctional DNA primase/polymerase [Nocardia terpenica]MBF6106158.1 bifunctional DNA primase/polymerase [Nocardia terpenica]MBF6110462.1 bifunctional DNA primase/polymerase [Nocardia terpenica]MBF6120701.1 bifunctional DNA primase/polymerase [Nocardia terpenica]MBF6151798.1 bifunctional DNA primase/polymerase [Nocardia terpenica]
MSTNPFRDAALAAAERGWFVFPLRPNRKTPAPLHIRNTDGTPRTWPDYATTDTDRIHHWWSGHRRYNIAIATGPSNLHVIDIDHPSATDDSVSALTPLTRLTPSHAQPPTTFTVRTPHGRHLYFHAPTPPLRCTVARIAPGIDSRGLGGYVVAAGSRTAHGIYQIVDPSPVAHLPSWLADRLAPPPPPLSFAHPSAPTAYLSTILTTEAARVATAEHHTRNRTLFRSAFTLGRLVAAGELTEHDARTTLTTAASRHIGHHGFTHAELDRTLTNGLRYGARYPRQIRRNCI